LACEDQFLYGDYSIMEPNSCTSLTHTHTHTHTIFTCFAVELFTLSQEKIPESSGDCYGSSFMAVKLVVTEFNLAQQEVLTLP